MGEPRTERLKIAYISSDDPMDKTSWSGSHYSIYTTLSKNLGSITVLGPYFPFFQIFIGKITHFLSQKLFNTRYNYRHSKAVAKASGRFFTKKIKAGKYDLIIASSASCEIAYVKTSIPIVYIADATFKSSLNYHKALSGLSKISIKEGLSVEQLALNKSSVLALTSPWASNSAINDYRISKEKVITLPFGANFEEIPDSSFAENKNTKGVCKLLFVGVYWENKGGPIAYNVLIELLKNGIDAELIVCGCTPPEEFKHEKIKVIPFLNKKIKEEREQLYNLFKEASFLLFPTRFEAFGIVVCEASAYGLISLATNTGGVSGVVNEGGNGFLFDSADMGIGYANKIMELWNNEVEYKKLAVSSRHLFETRLNWNSWALSLKNKLEELHIIKY